MYFYAKFKAPRLKNGYFKILTSVLGVEVDTDDEVKIEVIYI